MNERHKPSPEKEITADDHQTSETRRQLLRGLIDKDMASKELLDMYANHNQVLNELWIEFDKLDETKRRSFIERLWAKEKESFASVDKPLQYIICHMHVGGTASVKDSPFFDFDGEHSLQSFCKKLLEEIRSLDKQ